MENKSNTSNTSNASSTNNINPLFIRYPLEKYDKFQLWLKSKHGSRVYALFVKFAKTWRDAGNDKCGASLIGNRIRWEMAVGAYQGFKVQNDWLPMMARQLIQDNPTYRTFFNLRDEA